MLNQTNQFAQFFIGQPIPAGQRFISVGVSEFNFAHNPTHTYHFNPGAGAPLESILISPGRGLITGINFDPTLANGNAFKISALRGVKNTAPYFHDNNAKTLEAVAAHYAFFFNVVTGGVITLTSQDQADIVAYMKLLE
jgi:cytochrome c peroxidase